MTSPAVERVLLVHDYAGSRGGAELVINDFRNALRARGVDARLLASDADGESPDPPPDYLFRGSTGPARALREVANPSLIRIARRVLADFDPQVVHLGMFLTQVSPLILPLIANRAVVWVPNEFRATCPKGTRMLPDRSRCEHRIGRACLREGCFSLKGLPPRLLQLALLARWRSAIDRVVSPSRSFANDLARHGLACDAVIAHPTAAPDARQNLAAAPLIGFAGRLVPEKGVDVLIRAMARLRRIRPDAQLLILGDGPERPTLVAQAHELGLRDYFECAGHVTRDEVHRRLAAAWVQVVPSLWAEPFGLATVEAMARGTVVVASDVGAQPELIDHERTGFLVPGGDAETLSHTIASLLSDRERLVQIGTAARRHVRDALGVEPITDRFIRLYQDVLEQRRTRRA